MYVIYKNNRKLKSHNYTLAFWSYEQARQFVRKQLRKTSYVRHKGQPDILMCDRGYKIRHETSPF